MNTTERISKILKDIYVNEFNEDIIKIQLEALVLQAQLEQIQAQLESKK